MSNPKLLAEVDARMLTTLNLKNYFMVRWPSGLRRTLGKRVYGNVPRVRIPLSPPYINQFLAIIPLV